MRSTKFLGPVLALPLLLLLTACANEVAEDDPTGPSRGRGLGLSECMRTKGYEMSDTEAAPRSQTIAPPAGVDAEQWKQDFQTCAEGGAGAGESGVAPATRLTTAQMQRLARCMREHGFADFPDDVDAAYTPDDPDTYRQVSEECDAALDGAEG